MKPKTPQTEEASGLSVSALIALQPTLLGYALKRLRSRPHADDVVQDTLERAWRARETFRTEAELKPWLFSILRHTMIDHHRRDGRIVEDVDGVRAASLAIQPDQLWRLRLADIVVAIDTLSPNQRRALLLVVHGATTVEAATVMECPLGTLKSHLRLGRRKLEGAGV